MISHLLRSLITMLKFGARGIITIWEKYLNCTVFSLREGVFIDFPLNFMVIWSFRKMTYGGFLLVSLSLILLSVAHSSCAHVYFLFTTCSQPRWEKIRYMLTFLLRHSVPLLWWNEFSNHNARVKTRIAVILLTFKPQHLTCCFNKFFSSII